MPDLRLTHSDPDQECPSCDRPMPPGNYCECGYDFGEADHEIRLEIIADEELDSWEGRRGNG